MPFALSSRGGLPLYEFRHLQQQAGLAHFVSSRHGGESDGDFASLNISFSTGDLPERVQANRNRIAQALGLPPGRLVFARQTHGRRIFRVEEDFFGMDEASRAGLLADTDALITQAPQACLCVTAADCVPILLYDPEARAVGAVHAGWRGTAQRIASHTVQAMQEAFGTRPERLLAGIGPSIGGEVYEVGPEVLEAMRQAMGSLQGLARHPRPNGHACLDLWEANRQQLLEAGVGKMQIEVAGVCTYTHHRNFFSARRLGGKGGRFAAGISLR
jgi:hypothetical protein